MASAIKGPIMSVTLSTTELLAALKKLSVEHGLTVRDGAGGELAGEAEKIGAKWWFGGRKVTYRMSLRPVEADRTVHFRDVVVERSWGIPPPTLTVETTTTSGWKRSGTRKDVSLGGQGGAVDYAGFRDAAEQAVKAAGWNFHLEGGRLP